MAKQIQLRGGTTAETNAFTGANREVTVDTDKDTLVVHDGTTAGGFPLAKESNVPNGSNSAITDDGSKVTITGPNNAYLNIVGAEANEKHLDFYEGATKKYEVFLDGSEKLNFRRRDDDGTSHMMMSILPTGGIAFNGDTSSANALDDYEEGGFNPLPVVTYNPGDAEITNISGSGYYTKIGNIVYATFEIEFDKSGDCNIGVDGLPFEAKDFYRRGMSVGTARRYDNKGTLHTLEGLYGTQIKVIRSYDNTGIADGDNIKFAGSTTYQIA